ncbi:twin-arginine translocase TatA/TatE family subunit [Candidatus Bathyarchaeota archaeon]|nr:twin-arginine translocase TatA/TatE family subunit [Candidatus Bathyarchaeota archaeon]
MLGWQEVILVLAILLLVFGPAELPKIARELGKAWNEFNKASSGIVAAATSPQSTKDENKNKQLSEAAAKLNVKTEGKTDQQLTEEILAKILNKEGNSSKNQEEAQ